MNPRIYRFLSTQDAYDESQTNDTIRDGDVLSVPDEQVAGVLIAAWPVAVGEHAGVFHTASADFDWSAVPLVEGAPPRDYSASYKLAREELVRIVAAEGLNRINQAKP